MTIKKRAGRWTALVLTLMMTLSVFMPSWAYGSEAVPDGEKAASEESAAGEVPEEAEESPAPQAPALKAEAPEAEKAAPPEAVINVTVTDKGKLAKGKDGKSMSFRQLDVTDSNGDGKLTVDDAMVSLHDTYYAGGKAGYATSPSQWGDMITSFWGDTSGAYGYYLNDEMCMGITDAVKAGDHLKAYIYKDKTGYSDVYTYFSQSTYSGKAGGNVEVRLMKTGFDASFNPVKSPCAGAVIEVEGSSAKYNTDEDGRAVVPAGAAGTYTVNAYSDDGSIVPSTCTLKITGVSADVKVSVAAEGAFVKDRSGRTMAGMPLSVGDSDEDGKITVRDVMVSLHEKHCPSGTDGFAAEGAWIKKFWGDTSGAFGYYLNNIQCMGLGDPVKDGDHLKAYIYRDQVAWSDKYTFFQKETVELTAGDEAVLTLMGTGFNENYETVTGPCEGASVRVDGRDTIYTTDKDGKVRIPFSKAGTYTVSAFRDDGLIVPSSCTVKAAPLEADIKVSVAVKGEFAEDRDGGEMAGRSVRVTDVDGDGKLTVDDAMKVIHEQFCSEGLSGYETSNGWISKFWGDTSGAFGYYLNDAMCMGISERIRNGDSFKAYIYKDQVGWSDRYTFFGADGYSCREGEKAELTLMEVNFDASFQMVTGPCAGASVKVQGSDAVYTTGRDGKVRIPFMNAGTYVVRAYSGDGLIVPSICTVTVGAQDGMTDAVRDVLRLIDALPEPEDITLAHVAQVREASDAYRALSAAGKALVPDADRKKLEAAEARIKELQKKAPESFDKAYDETGRYIGDIAREKAAFGAEWSVMGLARAGRLDSATKDRYYSSVAAKVKSGKSAELGRYSTDNARTVLALTAMGTDPRDVEGYDLLEPLADFSKVKEQGVNGSVFALLAFDSHGYDIPDVSAADPVTRDKLVGHILSSERRDGGWSWSPSDPGPDPDMTAMAVQALAPYAAENADAAAAVDRAVDILSRMQRGDGTFSSWGNPNSMSCAQVITALTAAGIDPVTDPRFIKNGSSLMDGLLGFYNQGGGFTFNGELNGMATDQGYYAMAAYDRFRNGKTRLYDMTDVTLTGGNIVKPEQDAKPETDRKPQAGGSHHTVQAGALSAATKSADVKLSGSLSDDARRVVEDMKAVLSGDDDIEKIKDVYSDFLALSDDERKAVEKTDTYRDFMEEIASEIGKENHYDSGSGVDLRDNSEDDLPWYIVLKVEEKDISSSLRDKVAEVLGEESELFSLYDIKLVNTLDGTEWEPSSDITVKVPAEDTGDYEAVAVIHVGDDGGMEVMDGDVKDDEVMFQAASFSQYGVAGFNGSVAELLNGGEDRSILPWILAAAAAAVLLILVLVIRRRRAS